MSLKNCGARSSDCSAARKRWSRPLLQLEENPHLDGLTIAEIPARSETGVVVSRILPAKTGQVHRAGADTVVHPGDCILAVGTRAGLAQFERVVEYRIEADLMHGDGELDSRKVVVTQPAVVGRTIGELAIELPDAATITRVYRGDFQMTARDELRPQFGDRLQIVGKPDGMDRATVLLGNSQHALQVTNFIPIFLGIALGVIAGVLPLQVPGIPLPVRLGIAGGPLLLAIVLSRIGRIGPLLL